MRYLAKYSHDIFNKVESSSYVLYIYIYIYIIIVRCLRLSVVSNLYPSLVDFVMANCMSSILDADPRGMNSMIAYASDLRLHHRTHR